MEIAKIARLVKVGDSLAVIIPKPVVRAMNFKRGDQFVCAIYDETTIYLRKLDDADLLKFKPPAIIYK